jgi:flagellar protein FlaG
MDIQAPKPVSAVPASSNATGKFPALVVTPEAPPPVEPVREVAPTAQNLQQTQQAIAEQVSRYLQSSTRNLEFQVDNESGSAVIVVRDASGNVVRRIPGEEALQRMLRASAESGTLIDSSA